MAFRFSRAKILPVFLSKRITTEQLARNAGVAIQTAERAVNGQRISARVVDGIASALNVDAVQYLAQPAHYQEV